MDGWITAQNYIFLDANGCFLMLFGGVSLGLTGGLKSPLSPTKGPRISPKISRLGTYQNGRVY